MFSEDIAPQMMIATAEVKMDNEGRIMIPEAFLDHASITDRGDSRPSVQPWTPDLWQQRMEEQSRRKPPQVILSRNPQPDKEGSRWLASPTGYACQREALTPAKVQVTLMPLSDAAHSRAILEAAECKVVAIDRDPEAIAVRTLSPPFQGDWPSARAGFLNLLTLPQVGSSNLMLFSIRVYLQIDAAERGFLSRTMARLICGWNATMPVILSTASPQRLERVLRDYGEERAARRIARAICTAREETPITRTLQLADITAPSCRARNPARSILPPAA